VKGIAAVFNSRTELWPGVFEEVATGAFDTVMSDDVRALFNHDPNYILGRTKAGTLNISKETSGLAYEFEAPNTTAGNDLIESLSRGDIDQSSFAFTVEKSSWTDLGEGKWLRTIEKVKRLYDVSPVTYPAYEDTNVSIARDEFNKRNDELEAEKNEAEKLKLQNQNLKLQSDLLKLKLNKD
jgi:hypothetical protein